MSEHDRTYCFDSTIIDLSLDVTVGASPTLNLPLRFTSAEANCAAPFWSDCSWKEGDLDAFVDYF